MTTNVKLNAGPYAMSLLAGQILTVTADDVSSGRIWRKDALRGAETSVEPVAASATVKIGPFGTERRMDIEALEGSLNFDTAPYDPVTTFAPILTNNVVDLIGDGAPVDYTDGDPVATGQDIAGPGSRYTDISGVTLYVNTGTKAEPTWAALAFAA